MLLSLHPNIIVHVENVVSLFSSPFTSSQKVQKCGGHKFLDQILVNFYLRSCRGTVGIHPLRHGSRTAIEAIRDSRQFPAYRDRTEDGQ